MTGLINYHQFSLSETPGLHGKYAVITGGTRGIGEEMTAQLLLHKIDKVFVLGRSRSSYDTACQVWLADRRIDLQDSESRSEFVECDLMDILSVKKTADYLKRQMTRLDILINNAGLATVPQYELSPQGIENIFATNHIGHFTLTLLLLPLLAVTADTHETDVRIVNTSSSFHMGCQSIDFASLTSPARTKYPASFDSMYRYARSKLANILFTRQLSQLLLANGQTSVYVNCFFPGNIPTEAMDEWKNLFGSLVGALVKGTFKVIGQTKTQAAATAIYLATSPRVVEGKGQRGSYFIPIAKQDKTSKVAEDMELARSLWAWSHERITETLGHGWDETKLAREI